MTNHWGLYIQCCLLLRLLQSYELCVTRIRCIRLLISFTLLKLFVLSHWFCNYCILRCLHWSSNFEDYWFVRTLWHFRACNDVNLPTVKILISCVILTQAPYVAKIQVLQISRTFDVVNPPSNLTSTSCTRNFIQPADSCQYRREITILIYWWPCQIDCR